MKNQAVFSLKDKSKKLKCHLLQFLFGALRVNCLYILYALNSVATHPPFITGQIFYIQILIQLYCKRYSVRII